MLAAIGLSSQPPLAIVNEGIKLRARSENRSGAGIEKVRRSNRKSPLSLECVNQIIYRLIAVADKVSDRIRALMFWK
jgi:hypothetical protein